MSFRLNIIKESFRSRVSYSLLNFLMNYLATRTQRNGHAPTADVNSVLTSQGLELVESGFFRGKNTVSRVRDKDGKQFILKTGGIEPLQVELFETAKRIESELSFRVPSVARHDHGWVLFEEIEGKMLNDFFTVDTDWCISVCKRITDGYQLIIREMQKNNKLPSTPVLGEGKEWVYSRLNLWSKPLLDAGLIDFSFVQNLCTEFGKIIESRGDNFFGFAHGNIIGDHIVVTKKKEIYLLDLTAELKPGWQYYDFLRALDFLLVKTPYPQTVFESIPGWLRTHLNRFDYAEVRLVFALRNLGILGWDILHHKMTDIVHGRLEDRKRVILRLITGQYQ